jgi:hypothetical protein
MITSQEKEHEAECEANIRYKGERNLVYCVADWKSSREGQRHGGGSIRDITRRPILVTTEYFDTRSDHETSFWKTLTKSRRAGSTVHQHKEHQFERQDMKIVEIIMPADKGRLLQPCR